MQEGPSSTGVSPVGPSPAAPATLFKKSRQALMARGLETDMLFRENDRSRPAGGQMAGFALPPAPGR